MDVRIGVVGLGYVGLPVALAFAREFDSTVGFDISATRIKELRSGLDSTGEVGSQELLSSSLAVTDDIEELSSCNFFVIGVPTPIDKNHRPDLSALVSASQTVGSVIRAGSIVVYESTVYPGVTEEVCGPVLEEVSGLIAGRDFGLAYSPERINPGDKVHTLENVVKVVSGQDSATLEKVAHVYSSIIKAGVHRAPSIKVAEAAKVIENTQRDLNIALMNELSIIFDRLGVRTQDVLAAAGTKWNFLNFVPGLVGGHCIGVDPYYLTTKAEELGYHPEVILAGRRINEGVGPFIAQKMVKLLVQTERPIKKADVAILGITFKENVSDIRNSRVPSIVSELKQFGVNAHVHDPLADPSETMEEYGVQLVSEDEFPELDGVILAVAHEAYDQDVLSTFFAKLRSQGVLIDVKSVLSANQIPDGAQYWGL